MKQVDVYEISKTVRTVEAPYDEIPFQEFVRDGGKQWGNPDGGGTFIRYSAPVTRVSESWVEDGFTHSRDYYVAIAPRLLDLLAPAVDATLSTQVRARAAEIKTLREKAARDRDAWRDLALKLQAAVHDLENANDRIGNFLEANVLKRIWRAIRREL